MKVVQTILNILAKLKRMELPLNRQAEMRLPLRMRLLLLQMI